jgi:protein-L-isoaspartate(D-aspartate) O-methyltransferase
MRGRPARLAGFPATLASEPKRGEAGGTTARPVLRPQRPLQQAATDAARRNAPSGLGLDSAAVRQRMVQRLREQGIVNEAVLAAFTAIERHHFVDTALANQAYEDTSLPIGLQQTISKPSVVARMLSLLAAGHHASMHGQLGKVLEIGTGCGYQTALLARLARTVTSIERLKGLHDKARDNLDGLRLVDVRLVFGDGRLGHAPRAPYQSIVAAAGGEALPQAWLDQLAVGGRLVAPVHQAGHGGQALLVVDRHAEGLSQQWFEGVHFVPLKSGAS